MRDKKWHKRKDGTIVIHDEHLRRAVRRLISNGSLVCDGYTAREIGRMIPDVLRNVIFIGWERKSGQSGIFITSPYVKFRLNGNILEIRAPRVKFY